MFSIARVGSLCEPLTGRQWGRARIAQQFAARVAYLRQHGLTEGDRVFLHYGNTIEFFVDLVAVWSLGGCAVPIDRRLTPYEVEVLGKAAAPRLSVWKDVDESIAARLSGIGTTIIQTPEDNPDDPGTSRFTESELRLDADALVLFTSGTTGQPKGVVHTHRSLRAQWTMLQQSLGIEKYRRTLCLLPTHFGHGLICNCLFPWLSGQDLYILPPFRADVMMQLGQLLDEHQITFMSSVPSVWRVALKTAAPPKLGKLERVSCGSAPLSAFLWRDIQRWTGTNEVLNTYGITETGSWVAGTTLPNFTPEDGLIGVPWGADVRILESSHPTAPPGLAKECRPGDEGYVWLSTPALMRGYLDRDDLTNQVVSHGWFLTGDIGVRDDRGVLYLRGREREEVNKGGMKIHPGEVDAVVEQFEWVQDVCTFGYEDALYGQEVGIAVVVERNAADVFHGLYEWTRSRLAEYKVPKRWYLMQEIPRTSRGKINRANVATACAQLEPIDL